MKPQITVAVAINAPIEKIWKYWTLPEHIVRWNFASDDWCAPRAENDLRVGGKFITRMEAKDGSTGFDFNGVYTVVESESRIEYMIEGGKKVSIVFKEKNAGCQVIESFDPEDENSLEMQRAGWQAILENFKKYVEA